MTTYPFGWVFFRAVSVLYAPIGPAARSLHRLCLSRTAEPSPEKRTMSEAAVVTANNTPYRVWITIYDLGKTLHLDYGWLEPASDGNPEDVPLGNRIWRGGYHYGDRYHVRGEVMDETGQVIADAMTQVSVHPAAGQADVQPGRHARDPALVLMNSHGRFWWQAADEPGGLSDATG